MCGESSVERRGHDLVRHRVDRAARRCGCRTGAPTWPSAPTTRPCTSSTARPARTSSRRSRPATSSRGRSPSIPDGFPLLYSGSRDNSYHVLALDRGEAMEELWSLSADAVSPTKWNNDWDGAGLDHRRLPVRGRREQPVPHREAEPLDGRRRQGRGRARARVQHPGLGRRAARRRSATRTCRSRTRSPSPATPSTSPTPAASCRAGTSPVWPRARPRSGRSGSGPATTPTPRSSSTSEGMLYVASEYERGNRAGPHQRPAHEARPDQAGRPARLEGRRPRHAAVGHVGDAGHPRRHGLRVDRRRSPARRRPGDRRGPVGEEAARARRGSRRWSSTTC